MSLSSLLRSARSATEKRPKLPGYYVRRLGRPLTGAESEVALAKHHIRPCDGYFAAIEKADQEGADKLTGWWRLGPHGGFVRKAEWDELWPHAVALELKRRRRMVIDELNDSAPNPEIDW